MQSHKIVFLARACNIQCVSCCCPMKTWNFTLKRNPVI